MSYLKDHLIEIEERGYKDSDKYICAAHINDSYISSKIRYSHNQGRCSFCGRRRNVVPFNDVLGMIVQFINSNYVAAYGNAIFDSEEKEYLDPIIDPYDFVFDELNSFLLIEDNQVLQEIFDKLSFEDRISQYKLGLRERQEVLDLDAWEEFCRLVKASLLSAEQIVSLIDKKNITEDLKTIRGMLERIWKYCKEQYLVKPFYGLSSQYRAYRYYRCVNYLPTYKDGSPKYAGLSFIPATLIGTAPAKLVKDNRMSEAGDMMFYGADDKITAISEVGYNEDNPITMGTFCSNKKFRILDLSDISTWKCPSVFDVDKTSGRNSWFFLKEFIKRISEEVVEPSSYKPTQLFTKFIQRKTDIQGIKYMSSKTGKGCYVLFVVNRDCLDLGDKKIDSSRNQLIMQQVEQISPEENQTTI